MNQEKDQELSVARLHVQELEALAASRQKEIPKLLLHRIVPNARYSIWLYGKLELVVDPYQILERFRFVFKLCSIPKDSSSNFRLIFIFKLQVRFIFV
ncbi:hypothetical protein P8452_16952 [Trifolium repens]|nr:hypothetical protein P8452_16952 [Trifolium repens]